MQLSKYILEKTNEDTLPLEKGIIQFYEQCNAMKTKALQYMFSG